MTLCPTGMAARPCTPRAWCGDPVSWEPCVHTSNSQPRLKVSEAPSWSRAAPGPRVGLSPVGAYVQSACLALLLHSSRLSLPQGHHCDSVVTHFLCPRVWLKASGMFPTTQCEALGPLT